MGICIIKDVNVINLTIRGVPVWECNITLYEGWNMIGSVIHNGIIPANITAMYTWDPVNKCYVKVDEIKPGIGVWILSKENITTKIKSKIKEIEK